MPRKEGGALRKYYQHLRDLRRRARKRAATYMKCPNCFRAYVRVVDYDDQHKLVYCPKCGIGLRLPKKDLLEDLDYWTALVDYVNGDPISPIFETYEEIQVTPEIKEAIRKYREQRRTEKKTGIRLTDEIAEKILALKRFTSADVAKLLNIDKRRARKLIRALRDMGVVRVAEVVGSKKIWEVVSQNAAS